MKFAWESGLDLAALVLAVAVLILLDQLFDLIAAMD